MRISYIQLVLMAILFTAANFVYQAFGPEVWRDAIMRSWFECVAIATVAACGWANGKMEDHHD